METKIAEIKRRLEQSGQEIRLGVGWRWLYPVPPAGPGRLPWTFLSYRLGAGADGGGDGRVSCRLCTESSRSCVPNRAGTAAPPGPRSQTVAAAWVVLAPLPRSEYAAPMRVQDLVQRMLAARIHGASAVFVPQPFDDQQGLMNADGSPGELFVPWRTTATLIGGAEYLGPIQLPGGSTCHAFGRDGQAILVIWNDHADDRALAAGRPVEQIDVWGRTVPPAASRIAGQLEREVASRPAADVSHRAERGGRPLAGGAGLRQPARRQRVRRRAADRPAVRNPFGQGVGGEVKLHAPASWGVDLAAGAVQGGCRATS